MAEEKRRGDRLTELPAELESGPPPAPGDVLSIVEAAYLVDLPFASWGQGVVAASDGAIHGGLHGFGCLIQLADGALTIARESVFSRGVPPAMLNSILDGLTHGRLRMVSRFLEGDPGPACCALTSELDTAAELSYRSDFATRGVADGVNLIARDLDGLGFLISFGVPGGYQLSATMRENLQRAATHLVTALRLRRRIGPSGSNDALAATPSRPAQPDAVLSPDGKLLHAEREAKLRTSRDALRAAVRDVERARSARPGERDQELARWKALVAARWSLIDQFEEGGRRFVVARDNPPRARDAAKLTQTESTVIAYLAGGFSTKEIAYTLGINAGTVRVLLMRASRRCGAKTRQALIEHWQAACAKSADSR